MTVYDDSTKTTGDRVSDIITNRLGSLKGMLQNINNTTEIRYNTAGNTPRTIYFYINNVPFPLKANASDVTKFELDPAGGTTSEDIYTKALNAMFNGENTIKLVFQSSKSYYEKVVRVNIGSNQSPSYTV